MGIKTDILQEIPTKKKILVKEVKKPGVELFENVGKGCHRLPVPTLSDRKRDPPAFNI